MALTDNRDTLRYGALAGIDSFPVGAGKTIFAGSLVAVTKSAVIPAYARPAGDVANLICKGVAAGRVCNSAGLSGDVNVETQYGEFEFKACGLTASHEGSPVYASDDDFVKLKAAVTHNIAVGIITKVLSPTSAKIMITPEAIRAAANF